MEVQTYAAAGIEKKESQANDRYYVPHKKTHLICTAFEVGLSAFQKWKLPRRSPRTVSHDT